MIKDVDAILKDWAEWVYKGVAGIGYSGESIEYKIMRGTVQSSGYGPQMPRYIGNRRMNKVNRIILEMPIEWQRIVRANYRLFDSKWMDGCPRWELVSMKQAKFYRNLDKIHKHIKKCL